ncbi:glutamate dehydrogenase (NADP) [Marinobacter daqiaonensis]|uniref:Glutamate dehydrogenase n=1 Tax=Marinobacter daqiaonensis TaxID=650891 RepID=A0A1I6J9P7_9GAMM|nr:NADP-specific glutamate dehydrogenase [Marinobacter daqiaonensis]SFR75689.1 glutamate dehydrogenase (NADP) [Marinobacter daqiaonensis]
MTAFQEQTRDYLKRHHPNSDEFHQAVREVYDDIASLYRKHRHYRDWNIAERMMEPDRIIRFRVCWEDDKGRVQVNRGWRVQFNNVLGAYKGGIRFHPSVNESVLKFLGFEQCFKNALTGLPMGGGKGGADFDPKGRSEREIMRFCQAYMQELFHHIEPQVDVPAGDIHVGSREIGYLYGHYLKLTHRWEGVLTGKSPNFGGSCGRTEATGFGVVYFLKDMLEAHDHELEGKRVMISGAGTVALYAAKKCIAEGASVITLSDSGGTLVFRDGLTEEEWDSLYRLKLEDHGELRDAEHGTFHQSRQPWTLVKGTIALPCATENEIDDKAMKHMLENGLVALCEGANMPLTRDARERLLRDNIPYGPGKAANAGGVAVSGLERSQNAALQSWSLNTVDSLLGEIMVDIHKRCIENVDRQNGVYPYSKGANIYGFRRLADAMVSYGIK